MAGCRQGSTGCLVLGRFSNMRLQVLSPAGLGRVWDRQEEQCPLGKAGWGQGRGDRTARGRGTKHCWGEPWSLREETTPLAQRPLSSWIKPCGSGGGPSGEEGWQSREEKKLWECL